MAQLYLLPCGSCDNKIEIELKQAGSEVGCPSCQSKTAAPTMGGIKKLEHAESSGIMIDPKSNSTASRHIGLKQWLFSGGLVVLVLAAVAGFATWFYADSLVTISNIDQRVAAANQQIPTISPAQIWDSWDDLTSAGQLPEWKEIESIGHNKQAAYLKNIAYGFIGLAAVGLLLLLSSFVIKQH